MFSKVQSYVSEKLIGEKKIPYIDIIVKKEHKTLFRYMQGTNYEPTGKELLCMYSCTKPLTAVCATRLIEEGKISPEDEVEKYLPSYKNVFLLDKDGQKVKPKNKMKIKHLLTMTSGLNYALNTQPILDTIKQTNATADTKQMADAFIKMPLEFEPGAQYMYSLSLDVMGAVIEVVSGMKLSEYMNKVIFAPLKMNNSGFDEKVLSALKPTVSYGNGEYVPKDLFYDFKFSPNYDGGGAGLISTVEDYSAFADALACDGVSESGYKVLGKDALDVMASEQISDIAVNNNFTCIQGDQYGYGYGVRVRKVALDCGVPVGEFGWDGAAGSYMLVDRKNNISVTMGMNLLNWPEIFGGEHLKIVQLIYESMKENKMI
jgi:CubicO group peptidase (beta-lactamase class C family)